MCGSSNTIEYKTIRSSKTNINIDSINIFFEPINLKTWKMFQVVEGVGHKEIFLATKEMKPGDLLLLHVGSQNQNIESGIYGVAKVIGYPEICEREEEYHCRGRLSVNTEIIVFSTEPIIRHKEFATYVNQFRSVHRIESKHYDNLKLMLSI